MTTTTQTTRYYISHTGRAFSCDAKDQGYRARVDGDGTVRVWDSVAWHWTVCHSLTPAQLRLIRARAK